MSLQTDSQFSMSPKVITITKTKSQKAPKSLELSFEPILSAYRSFIFPRCSNTTQGIIACIPRAVNVIEQLGIVSDPIGFLVSAIKKYRGTENYKWRRDTNYSLLAPSKFFSVKFVEENLVPLGDDKFVIEKYRISNNEDMAELQNKIEKDDTKDEFEKDIRAWEEKGDFNY